MALPQIIGGSGIPGRLQPQGNDSAFIIVRRQKEKYLPASYHEVRMEQLQTNAAIRLELVQLSRH